MKGEQKKAREQPSGQKGVGNIRLMWVTAPVSRSYCGTVADHRQRLGCSMPHQVTSFLGSMDMNLVKSVSQSTLAKWGASSLPKQHTAHASREVSSSSFSRP